MTTGSGLTNPPTFSADVLRRFASDEWRVRQAAERELIGLGEDVLPAIDELLDRR